MDAYSHVIATMRAGRAKFTRTRRTGTWGNSFGPYPGAGFHVVLHGSCWLIPPSGDSVELLAGDVVFLPHGARHGLTDTPTRSLDSLVPAPPGDSDNDPGSLVGDTDGRSGVDLLCGAYRLDRGQSHPFLRSLPDVIHLPSGGYGDLRVAVDLLVADLAAPRPGSGAALPALLDLLLVYLLRAWRDDEVARNPTTGWPAAFGDPVLATALRHIHNDPAHPWTVVELSAATGVSRTALVGRFRTFLGQPPRAYLTWWRLNTAARLLRETDSPLATIAGQVGYSSEFAFANAFRREYGVAPGRFRREPDEPL